MHCPNCRHDNVATTRFCTSCGAVLVESARDGTRRRVLRPWGLRSAAPPTESPAMPELAEARRQRAPRRAWSRRLDLRVAAGAAVVALAGTFLYPSARSLDPGLEAAATATPIAVTAMSTHAVREAMVVAPPLVELVRAPALAARSAKAALATRREAPAERSATADERGAPATALTPPPVRAVVAESPVVVAAAAPPVAPALPPDRWAPLRSALGQCTGRPGIFERASCEQAARIAHCADFWGQTPLCPAGRQDYGQ